MSDYGSVENIKCKIGVTKWFELWSYDAVTTGNIYIENGPGRVCNGSGRKISGWKRARPKRDRAGSGQIISARADCYKLSSWFSYSTTMFNEVKTQWIN